jgi:hypothetical protein
MNYELKHIHGIPYYLHGTTIHTFELNAGRPSEHCIAIGHYDASTDTIHYDDDWQQRVQPRLDAFRSTLQSQARNAVREHIKPQKQRVSTRAPRKPTRRTKNPASVDE